MRMRRGCGQLERGKGKGGVTSQGRRRRRRSPGQTMRRGSRRRAPATGRVGHTLRSRAQREARPARRSARRACVQRARIYIGSDNKRVSVTLKVFVVGPYVGLSLLHARAAAFLKTRLMERNRYGCTTHLLAVGQHVHLVLEA